MGMLPVGRGGGPPRIHLPREREGAWYLLGGSDSATLAGATIAYCLVSLRDAFLLQDQTALGKVPRKWRAMHNVPFGRWTYLPPHQQTGTGEANGSATSKGLCVPGRNSWFPWLSKADAPSANLEASRFPWMTTPVFNRAQFLLGCSWARWSHQ